MHNSLELKISKKPPLKLLLKLSICVQHPGKCEEGCGCLCPHRACANLCWHLPGTTVLGVTLGLALGNGDREQSESLPAGAGALLSACAFVVLNNET